MTTEKNWVEVSESRLAQNYDRLVRAATENGRKTDVLAVVKARAYGHGAELSARVLASAGASWFGVSDALEGAKVRSSLESLPSPASSANILVMCGLLPQDVQTILQCRLTPAIWTLDQVDWLVTGTSSSSPLPVHIEIDTGMSRQGVLPGPILEQLLDRLDLTPSLRVGGVFTHFADAEISGSALTTVQKNRFEGALSQISRRSLRLEWIHAGNSSTIDDGDLLPWLHQIACQANARSLVRAGLAMYGYCLPLRGKRSTLLHDLEPVLHWKTRVIALSDLCAGSTIGYNGTFVATEKMCIALLPVGYADGLRRELSGTNAQPGGWVRIRGKSAPIVGRISMNLTTVDVTNLGQVEVNDEVILIGEGVTAADHAELAHTLPYEILCGLRASPQLKL